MVQSPRCGRVDYSIRRAQIEGPGSMRSIRQVGPMQKDVHRHIYIQLYT